MISLFHFIIIENMHWNIECVEIIEWILKKTNLIYFINIIDNDFVLIIFFVSYIDIL